MMQTQEHVREHELGDLLRYWRHERGKSQLDLSLDTGISQRHLSFVESGRSVPSRDLLLIVSEKLDIPLRERNVLLLASGYAPIYEESWEVLEMAAVTTAIDRMLLQQEPHPALVLDRHWNVIRTNDAAPRFFGSFVDLEARQHPRNLLDLMFDPAGMRPFVENWEVVAAGLLQRVYRESVGHIVDQKTVMPVSDEFLPRSRSRSQSMLWMTRSLRGNSMCCGALREEVPTRSSPPTSTSPSTLSRIISRASSPSSTPVIVHTLS